MEQEKIDHLIMMHRSKFSPEYIEAIRKQLEGVDYDKAIVAFSDVKDPTVMLIISIFLGGLGVDRFMIGDYILGGGKLGLFIVGWFLCFFPWIGWVIWGIIDWFLIMGATRKYNSNKVLERLALIG